MHNYDLLEIGQPLTVAKKALILLHGRGGNAEDIMTLAKEFIDKSFYAVAPRASGYSWYPNSFMSPESYNEPWLDSAVNIVRRLVDEISGSIPRERIYIMGFSQGACLALETATRFATQYGGIAAFSGGLIGDVINPSKYSGNFNGTRVFIGNSDDDPHIPVSRCEESSAFMQSMGADVTMKIYHKIGHTITIEEVNTVKDLMFPKG